MPIGHTYSAVCTPAPAQLHYTHLESLASLVARVRTGVVRTYVRPYVQTDRQRQRWMERNSGVLARETKRPRAAVRTHARTVSPLTTIPGAVGRTGTDTTLHRTCCCRCLMACVAFRAVVNGRRVYVQEETMPAQQHAYHATGRMHLGHALLINQANSRRIIAVIVLCRLLSRACFTKKSEEG